MISAVCFLLSFSFHSSYPALHLIPNAALRRLLMGVAMGINRDLYYSFPDPDRDPGLTSTPQLR